MDTQRHPHVGGFDKIDVHDGAHVIENIFIWLTYIFSVFFIFHFIY